MYMMYHWKDCKSASASCRVLHSGSVVSSSPAGRVLCRPRALLPSGLQLQHADQNVREEDPGRSCLRPSEQSGASAPRSTVWPSRAVPLFRAGHLLSAGSLRVGLLPLPQGTATVRDAHSPLLPLGCCRQVVLRCLECVEWASPGAVLQSWTHTLSFWILYSLFGLQLSVFFSVRRPH